MITDQYRKKTLEEYADAGRIFADIINEDGCNSTAFILFKLLTDIAERLEGIEDKLSGIDDSLRDIVNDGITAHNK